MPRAIETDPGRAEGSARARAGRGWKIADIQEI